jgi:CBS-domain-containing membrane protein
MKAAEYLRKLRGGGSSPPGVEPKEIFWAFVGSFLGIGMCAVISAVYLEPRDLTLIIGSFGASAVLAYGAIKSPLAHPRNLVGGQIISALVGVACYKLFGGMWLGAALGVSLAVAAMLVTRTLHPPGGATALIAITGSKQIHDLGFFYVLLPVTAGVLVLLLVALIVNNMARHRRYPEYWL